jgi:hypothetical protein
MINLLGITSDLIYTKRITFNGNVITRIDDEKAEVFIDFEQDNMPYCILFSECVSSVTYTGFNIVNN